MIRHQQRVEAERLSLTDNAQPLRARLRGFLLDSEPEPRNGVVIRRSRPDGDSLTPAASTDSAAQPRRTRQPLPGWRLPG